jgi:hypothetical protein
MKLSKPFCRGLALSIGFLWILSLGSCTVYRDPLLVKYDDVNQRREFEDMMAKSKAAAASAPAPTPEPPKTATITACSRFAMPALGTIPRLTAQQIDQIAMANTVSELRAANNLYLDELEKIYKYTAAEEKALTVANAAHQKTCRRVTVEK